MPSKTARVPPGSGCTDTRQATLGKECSAAVVHARRLCRMPALNAGHGQRLRCNNDMHSPAANPGTARIDRGPAATVTRTHLLQTLKIFPAQLSAWSHTVLISCYMKCHMRCPSCRPCSLAGFLAAGADAHLAAQPPPGLSSKCAHLMTGPQKLPKPVFVWVSRACAGHNTSARIRIACQHAFQHFAAASGSRRAAAHHRRHAD